jgi:hypothetical protein
MISCTDFHTFLKSNVQILNKMWWNEWVHEKEENWGKLRNQNADCIFGDYLFSIYWYGVSGVTKL